MVEKHIQYLDAKQQQELGTREFTTSRLSNRMMEIIDRVATITDPDNNISQSKFNRLLRDTQRFAVLDNEVDRARALENRRHFILQTCQELGQFNNLYNSLYLVQWKY